ncbi:hypothetical protein FHT32_001266 [Variovorax sp. SG517]|uniref:hypothetical protein n=1 Tax=Variovorax sp. SG517 TaxID=2587117 RepID=UPI00159D8842|nr:hypothetical protein [Variovorax sp. SG517]NVM87627.1 hypothetical protein [Variovorax sp. SG517]
MTDTTNNTTGAGEGADEAGAGTGAGGSAGAAATNATAIPTGAGAGAGGSAGAKEPGRGRGGARAKRGQRAKALGVVQLERNGKVVEIPPGEEFDASAEELDPLVDARFAVRVGADDDEAAE